MYCRPASSNEAITAEVAALKITIGHKKKNDLTHMTQDFYIQDYASSEEKLLWFFDALKESG